MKWLCGLSVAILMLGVAQPASAQAPRQKYSDKGWQRDPNDKNRYVIKYFFRQRPDDDEYQLHEVYYYPDTKNPEHKKWLYYYNPEKETFWCRALAYYSDDDLKKGEIWNVIPKDDGREKTIKSSYDKGKFRERMSFEHATIPDSPDRVPMLLPPPPPA